MRNGASKDEGFGKDWGLVHEVITRARKYGLGRNFWIDLAHGDSLKKVADLVKKERQELLEKIFISPEDQIRKVREINKEFKMGFSEKDFNTLGDPPERPNNGEIPVVYLEFFVSDDLIRNFYFLLHSVVCNKYQTGFLHDFSINEKFIEPYEGVQSHRGLRWRITDVGEKMEMPFQDTLFHNPQSSFVQLGVLCMAILFPGWTKNLGIRLPRVALTGVQARKRNVIDTYSKYREHRTGYCHPCYVPVLTNERAGKYGSPKGEYLEIFEFPEAEKYDDIVIPLLKYF